MTLEFEMIYCDLDGVLVNFQKATSTKIGMDITTKEFDDLGQAKRNTLYHEVCDTVDFWVQLEPMPDYNDLWGYIRYWNPTILTAYPMWRKDAKDIAIKGKQLWNRAHMMVPENRFICCERAEKQLYALNKTTGQANVLIDDKDTNIEEWIAAGGVGILHTSAAQTVTQLRILGFNK